MLSFLIIPHLFGNWAIFLLRIILGLILAVHGWAKLKNLKSTSVWFASVGFKPGGFWAPLVAIVEFFGGLGLALGFFVTIISALVVIQFLVINIWKIAKKDPLVGGFEFDLVILGAALVVLTVDTDVSLPHLLYWLGLF